MPTARQTRATPCRLNCITELQPYESSLRQRRRQAWKVRFCAGVGPPDTMPYHQSNWLWRAHAFLSSRTPRGLGTGDLCLEVHGAAPAPFPRRRGAAGYKPAIRSAAIFAPFACFVVPSLPAHALLSSRTPRDPFWTGSSSSAPKCEDRTQNKTVLGPRSACLAECWNVNYSPPYGLHSSGL